MNNLPRETLEQRRLLSADLHATFHVSSNPSVICSRNDERIILYKFLLGAMPQPLINDLRQKDNIDPILLSIINHNSKPVSPSVTPLTSSSTISSILSRARSSPDPSVSSNHGHAMYITGSPGTGKTLTVAAAIESLGISSDSQDVLVININAMGLKEGNGIYNAIMDCVDNSHFAQYSPQSSPTSIPDLNRKRKLRKNRRPAEEEFLEMIVDPAAFINGKSYSYPVVSSNTFSPSHDFGKTVEVMSSVVLVIDEIDSLITKDPSTLYSLFSAPYLTNSKLFMIGIANSIDLTDRVLEDWSTRQCKPSVLVYQRYAHSTLLDVLYSRVSTAVNVMADWCVRNFDSTDDIDSFEAKDDEQTRIDTSVQKRKAPRNIESASGSKRPRLTIEVDSCLAVTAPLTPEQVKTISFKLIEDNALKMCSRQVANFNGDVRLALDILRDAFTTAGLFQVPSLKTCYLLSEIATLLNLQPPSNFLCENNADELSTAPLTHEAILSVVQTKFVPPRVTLIQKLPMQQQLLLCCAILTHLSRGGNSSELNSDLLQKCCNMLIKNLSLPEINDQSYIVAFDALDGQGLFMIKKVVENKRFFSISASYEDISYALRDKLVFRNVFTQGDQLVNKQT